MLDHPGTRLVAPLSSFTKKDVGLAGGKGANLGELWHAGFAVPPGFIITTVAYDLLLQSREENPQLQDVLFSLHARKPDAVIDVGHKIRNLLQQTPIPRQIADQIVEAYHQLGEGAVAVRSSATAEDMAEATFAGQQETFLNVIGEQALIEAVRACWTSLWSERAILYRARQSVDQNNVKLAVVVQTMIEADAAGVMFTANPVSGVQDEIVIDANMGLGEGVVGGLVTPDHFVVNKRWKRIKEKRIGRKEVIVRAKPGGGTEQIESTREKANVSSLPDKAIIELAHLGIDIERHYGVPQDIEWAWLQNQSDRGKIYILQSRPITALPEPLHVRGPMRLVLPMLAEMWPTRPYPLDMTTFTGTIERAIGGLLIAMIGKSAPSPDESFIEDDGVVVQFKPPQLHPSPSMVFTPWITMWRTRHKDLARWEEDSLLMEYISKARAIEKRDLQSLSWEQNIESLKEALALIPSVMQLRELYFPKALLGLASLWLLLALARRRSQFGTLVSGVRTKTTETNEALEILARQIRSHNELVDIFLRCNTESLRSELEASEAGQAFLSQFQKFLDQYGHREISLTISQPAWKDSPENVLAILKVLAETEPSRNQVYDAWQKARDELLQKSILGSRFLRNQFLNSLSTSRALFQIREDTHFYATMVQPSIRRAALELGSRLVQISALDVREDVFHLKLEELETLGQPWPPTQQTIAEIRSLVSRRKTKRQQLANKPIIDPRLLSTPSRTPEGVIVSGTAGSPGIARGPVRIVHDVSEFAKLRAGDVLVAPVTNPAWTPLFQRAVAVVVDTGGSSSHAAIVAREYGIPAVMGTVNGTKELEDGQWIEVNGSGGFVLGAEESK